jgi:hypothetical protein
MSDERDAIQIGEAFLERMAECDEPAQFARFGRHASGSSCFIVRYAEQEFYFDIDFLEVKA